MSGMQSSEQVAKFEGILRAKGITDPVAEVLVKDPGLQGEGFASQAQYITIKFKNEGVQPLNLFAKVVSQSQSQVDMMDEVKAFEKETVFLTKYVPASQEMWRRKGFALRTLATHHAVSQAMIKEEGGPDNFFKKFPYLDLEVFSHPQFPTMMGPMFLHSLNANIGILENNLVKGKEETLEFLKGFQNKSLIDIILDNLKCDPEDLRTINHGDYWNNNMMFLKDGANKIVGHKAIDLQTPRYNTPALDLTYYLFTSVKTDVRIAHLKELLQFYLDILTKVSQDMGHPINLTYEQLYRQYRKRVNYGFWWAFAIAVGPGVQAMKGLDINTVDVLDWPKVFGELMKKWIVANPEFAQVIAKELVKLVREYKTLSWGLNEVGK